MLRLRLMEQLGILYFQTKIVNNDYAALFDMVPKLELQAADAAGILKCTNLEEIEFDVDKVRFWSQ